jgi:hypothetical protein
VTVTRVTPLILAPKTELVQPDSDRARQDLSIAHVIHSVAPEHGGTTAVVVALSEQLGALGHRVRVHATDFKAPREPYCPGYELNMHPNFPGTGRFGFSFQ